MIYRFIAIVTLGMFAAACSSVSTDEIGARITADELVCPPGVNCFSVAFDTNNPGTPASVWITNGKDDKGTRFSVTYPDGTKWSYVVADSQGSTQTEAIAAAQQVIAALEAQTGQALGPGMIEAIRSSVRAALGVPG